jgi:hypothetical protein
MTTPEDYERYADYCLNAAHQLADQETRRILREMAAEWLRLADSIQSSAGSEHHKTG